MWHLHLNWTSCIYFCTCMLLRSTPIQDIVFVHPSLFIFITVFTSCQFFYVSLAGTSRESISSLFPFVLKFPAFSSYFLLDSLLFLHGFLQCILPFPYLSPSLLSYSQCCLFFFLRPALHMYNPSGLIYFLGILIEG